jgi:hypothetical protein
VSKPLKFHQTLNQAPRSHARGKHRRADTSSHRRPLDRTYPSPGGSDEDGSVSITYVSWNSTGVSLDWGALRDAWKPKPPTLPYAGIRTGEIIGHRLWWVVPGGDLCSLAHRRIWQPDETIYGDIEQLAVGLQYGAERMRSPMQTTLAQRSQKFRKSGIGLSEDG